MASARLSDRMDPDGAEHKLEKLEKFADNLEMAITISSGEFLKAYGRISETALTEPVSITSHGRERLVLLSAAEYRRLKANDRQALYPWELDDAALTALASSEAPAEARAFDGEMD